MRKTICYPTLYEPTRFTPPYQQKTGTLTATYWKGTGGYDKRPFVIELYETK